MAGGDLSTHDHGHCIASALDRAESLCRESGKQLTPIRRRVLELVWSGHRPVNAYEVLHTLHAEGWGSSPPVAYRALSFLVELGLVHRVEHLNSFIGCSLGSIPDSAQIFVCTACGEAIEVASSAVGDGLRQAARAIGFTISHPIIEVEGLCRDCQAARSAPGSGSDR